jgi:hypothetical protein
VTETPDRFRKRPVEIEAAQWDGTADGATRIIDWILGHGSTASYICSNPDRCAEHDGDTPHSISIRTLEGTMRADLDDWVIREPFPTGDRQFYPCKPDIFAKTYEPAAGPAPATDRAAPDRHRATCPDREPLLGVQCAKETGHEVHSDRPGRIWYPAPADRADRRDRAAADALVADARRAVHEALAALPASEGDRIPALLADLETAVEKRMAMRSAVLREAADGFDAHAEKLLSGIGDKAVFVAKALQEQAAVWREAAETLRRMAAETPQPETRDGEIALLRLTVDAVEESRRELRSENARLRAQLWTLAAMLEGFARLLATSSRDWGQYAPDAWLWAIVCGWDCEDTEHDDTCVHGAMEEMQQRHGWDDAAVAKARRYRAVVRVITEPAPAVVAQHAPVQCAAAVLRKPHGPHGWEPQPGMKSVRCPGSCRCDHPDNEHSVYGCADGCPCEYLPARPAAVAQPDEEA